MAYRSKGEVTGGSGNITIPAPGSIVDLDILVAGILVMKNNSVTAAPSGWTLKATYLSVTPLHALYLYWKRASSESGDYGWTINNNGCRVGAIVCHSGRVTTGDPFDGSPTSHQDTATTHVATALSPAAAGDDLIAFFTSNLAGTWTAPASMVERTNDSSAAGTGIGNSCLLLGATQDSVSSGSTGTKTGTLTASGEGLAILGALLPAVVPVTFAPAVGGMML